MADRMQRVTCRECNGVKGVLTYYPLDNEERYARCMSCGEHGARWECLTCGAHDDILDDDGEVGPECRHAMRWTGN